MTTTAFLPAIGVLSGLALVFGAILAFASKVLHVEVDPKLGEIEDALPGLNCAVCGYVGCAQFAEAVMLGKVAVDGCRAGGAETAQKVGEVLGIEVEVGEPKKAYLICRGNTDAVEKRFEYNGFKDCRMVNQVSGGDKACQWGCLGYGSCTTVCPYDLITMDDKGLPIIDRSDCTGCGACVDICPRNTITLLQQNDTPFVACVSHDKARTVRQVCKLDAKTIIGCIGCKACVKVCPVEAIEFYDELAIIDPVKCNKCGECVIKCPTKCILTRQIDLVVQDAPKKAEEPVTV